MTLKDMLNRLDKDIPIIVEWGVLEFDKENKKSLITEIIKAGCWDDICRQNVARITMDTALEPNTMIIELEV